jgi:S-DNA-T family DNA segregation ATPase FtsK/SpoIIIE
VTTDPKLDNVRWLIPERKDQQDRPAPAARPSQPPESPRRRRLPGLLQVGSRRLGTGSVYDESEPDWPGTELEPVPPAELEPAVFEAELVDEPVPVDQPATAGTILPPWQRPAERRPVVPEWLRDRDQRHGATLWAGTHVRHSAAYYGVRLPWYGLRLALRSPRGVAVLAGRAARWALDTESASLMAAHASRGESRDYLAVARRRDERVRSRLASLAVLAVLAGVLLVLLWLASGPVVHVLLILGVLFGLGAAGRRRDKPIVTRAVDLSPRTARLTSEIVERGLRSLGLAALAKAEIRFTAPIVRDGPGWRAEVDLPHGITAAEVMERRDKLAAGLRRPLGCVWPEALARVHPGRLVLWVGDEDMATARAPAWPLARSGDADLFRPVPFGNDQRGRAVELVLMFASVLIGAMPRMGKTFALRVLLLAAALDPRAELWLYELKGTGDLAPLEPVAHRYASGFVNAAIYAALTGLRQIMDLIERRAATIRSLPREVCPENKVTPELASNRRLGLYPVVLAIDECQELFGHPDCGEEAGALATRIIKLGPAMGVMLLLGTQRPDSKSLPTGVTSNAGIRFCLRVMGQFENDAVLGTSSYRNGLRATTFTAQDRGIGYLIGGEGADAQIVHSSYIDGPAADRIAARARALREEAGSLSGHALGQAFEEPDAGRSLLEDLVLVFGADEGQAHSDVLCARLAEQWPSTYAGWQPAQLAAALKPTGIRTRDTWAEGLDGTRTNRKGVRREDVTAALADRAGDGRS